MGAEAGLAWLAGLDTAHFCVLEDGTIVDRFEPRVPHAPGVRGSA
jgi:hypothetical protein